MRSVVSQNNGCSILHCSSNGKIISTIWLKPLLFPPPCSFGCIEKVHKLTDFASFYEPSQASISRIACHRVHPLVAVGTQDRAGVDLHPAEYGTPSRVKTLQPV